jgi:hypothetical protein
MKHSIIALAAMGLAGCVSAGGDATPEPEAPPPAQMVCNAGAAQAYVGKTADAATGAAILKDSGARTLRWGPPNAAWTMDYRQDRVNVQYDGAMKIQKITCG